MPQPAQASCSAVVAHEKTPVTSDPSQEIRMDPNAAVLLLFLALLVPVCAARFWFKAVQRGDFCGAQRSRCVN